MKIASVDICGSQAKVTLLFRIDTPIEEISREIFARLGTSITDAPVSDVTGPQPDMAGWEPISKDGQTWAPVVKPIPEDNNKNTVRMAAPVQDKLEGADIPRARRARRTSTPATKEATPPISAGPVVITDSDLAKAASLAAGKHGPEKVKTVMSGYTTGPTIGSIPQEDRQAFLDALGA